MILYLDSSRGISAAMVLGALLDAGADAALVQRILGTVTLPRISLMRGKKHAGSIAGTVASVAISPVRRDTLFIDVLRALEGGHAPLAVRTWGGGMIARLLEAEAMARGEPLDAVPLADLVTVAELIAVSAALAALRVVRVYAAPLARSDEQRAMSNEAVASADGILSTSLLEEAGWLTVPDVAVTPGGAAILAALAEPGVPPLRLSAVGYGMSEGAPHLLRCWLGTPYGAGNGPIPSATRAVSAHHHPHDAGDDH
jgi:pyridinium-3,5-bisthiocarboxylic acid mononucleotide nickel chelatase